MLTWWSLCKNSKIAKVGERLCWWTRGGAGTLVTRECMEAPQPLLHLPLCVASIWLFLSFTFHNRPVIQWNNAPLSSVSSSAKLIKPEEGAPGNLWFIAICSEAQVQKHLTLQGACELGGGRGKSPGTETLTRWVCVQVHSVRTGLNCRIPTWCLRGCLTVWKSHTSSIRNIVTKGKIQENFFQLRGIISSLSKVRTHG